MNKKIEVLNSLTSFRSQLLNVVVYNGSNLSYSNVYDDAGLFVYAKNRSISGKLDFNNNLIDVNISSIGVYFRGDYNFSLNYGANFSYNGSCVSVTS